MLELEPPPPSSLLASFCPLSRNVLEQFTWAPGLASSDQWRGNMRSCQLAARFIVRHFDSQLHLHWTLGTPTSISDFINTDPADKTFHSYCSVRLCCPTTCWRALMTCLGKNPRNCLFTIDLLLFLVIYVPHRNNNRYEKNNLEHFVCIVVAASVGPFSRKYFQLQDENWMELYQFLLLLSINQGSCQ